jgi:hypothetical protein
VHDPSKSKENPMRRTAGLLTGILASALVLASPRALAEPQWDQAKVSAIAQELAASLRDLEITVKKDPTLVGTPMRAAQYQAREDLRQLVNTIDRLAASLEAGEGREETLPIYRRAEQHRRDAAEAARRADIPGATQEKIEKSREILAQLAPYYADVAAQ